MKKTKTINPMKASILILMLIMKLQQNTRVGKKEDFVWALQVLESLPKEKLVAICEHPEVRIKFTSATFDDVDEEDLVSVIVSDTTPELLLKVLKEMGYERK